MINLPLSAGSRCLGRVSAWSLLWLAVGASIPQAARAQDTPRAEAGLPAAAPQGQAFFAEQVLPILREHCYECHGGVQVKGGLHLTTRPGWLRGGELGPAVNEQQPGESLLLQAIRYEGLEMPPSGKLPAAQIETLTRWVLMGAPGPDDEPAARPPAASRTAPQVTPEARNFWSFRPLVRPTVPAMSHATWSRHPIDALLLARLSAAGLPPNPPAAKTVLLRRAYYDLTGLPPGPAEVQAFLADDSPEAFEKVIDRLLASPHYGERWGRHWLDLVRFAETNSYERDGAKPHVWRYRDYVIRAFNDDKPYDEFVIEQLAGDELEPVTPDRLIATGFYRLGIWDDEPSDPEQALYDDLDDMLSTTGQVFLGLTINCARCHDHKLDPIPQRDYYRLLAFLGGVTRLGARSGDSVKANSVRSIATPEEVQQQAQEITEHQRRRDDLRAAIEAIETVVQQDFVPVEHEEFKHEQNRLALVRKRVPAKLSQDEFARYEALVKEYKRMERQRPSGLAEALCVSEIGPTPRETHVLIRGSPQAKGELVQPGFLSVLNLPDPELPVPPPGASSSGRRLTLARWIASADHPLTARVMANRVWQYHFGRGLVRSPNNFGFQGDAPTHPELLDWLGSELIAHGWRLKPLHKQIMLSQAYQMSSAGNAAALAEDPENDLLWRFDMRRLEAEEVRDSILAVNDSLVRTLYGPSIFPVIEREVLAGQSQPGSGWGTSSPEQRCRRSVYIHVKRSLVTPIIASFDGADVDASCPVRFATTQPTQALGLLNSALLQQESRRFATALRQAAGDEPLAQVREALWRVLQRAPTPAEVERGQQFLVAIRQQYSLSEEDALQQFCLLALNLNEFMYLD